MPIDPNILLRGMQAVPDPQTPLEARRRALVNQQAEMQVQQSRDTMQRQQQVRQALQQAGGDLDAAADLVAGVDPETSLELRKLSQQRRQTDVAAQQAAARANQVGVHVVGNNLVDDTGAVRFAAPEKPSTATLEQQLAGAKSQEDVDRILGLMRQVSEARRAETPTPTLSLDQQLAAAKTPEEVNRVLGLMRQAATARREPNAPKEPAKPDFQWVKRGDTWVEVPRGASQPGDLPQGAATAGARPPNGQQQRALGFFNRAKQASDEIATMEGQIREMGLLDQFRLSKAPNFAQTQLGQSYTQAQRAFTEARLRKDSGAAIPEHEFENDRQTYFAQPGDSPQTLAQKARARAALLASLAAESGSALQAFYGDEADSMMDTYRKQSAVAGPMQKPIPGVPGAIAESTDGGKTWKRVK